MGWFIAAGIFAALAAFEGWALRDALNAGANTVPWSTGLLGATVCALMFAFIGFAELHGPICHC